MWSQPNIVALNRVAHAHAKSIERAARTGKIGRKKIECDNCEKKATFIEPYYDIFSDDPKGIIAACPEHEDWISESYFQCDRCDRWFVNNYTWELYHTRDHETGETHCLPCACEKYISNSANWLDLTDPETFEHITMDLIKQARHVIGVDMPVPKEIKFFDNAEFDSMSGESISGGGVEGLMDALTRAKDAGYTRALLILDAGYQFAVSIGIYVDNKEGE